jgi:hypothetical protein
MSLSRSLPAAALLALLLAAALATPTIAPAAAARSPRCQTSAFRSYEVVRAGPMNVLYPRRAAAAGRYARRMAREIRALIYPRFKQVLGRTPPGDGRERCFHGPDAKHDVIVAGRRDFARFRTPGHAVAFNRPFSGKVCDPRRASFTVLRAGLSRFVVAHELFHAFQSAFSTAGSCEYYGPWEEALATWGAEWVYPRDQDEHDHPGALEKPGTPLEAWGYAAWIFPRYLSERYGDDIVRRIEESKARWQEGDHVDRAIPGGMAERFPEFALLAFNDTPLPNVVGAGPFLRQWDRWAATPKDVPRTDLRLNGARTVTAPVPVSNLRVLGREYRRIAIDDPTVRRVTFRNPAAGQSNFHVRAMVRRADGAWRAENWDGRETVEFCRDDPAEDVREIVLVAANSHFRTNKRVDAQTRFVAEDSCALRFKVLAATVSSSTTASGESTLCDSQSGSIAFDGSAGEQALQQEDAIVRRFDQVDGRLNADVPARWHGHHLEGCRVFEEPRGACVRDMPDRTPTPTGTSPISVSVRGGWEDPQWLLTWGLERPSVGFFDAGDPECNVNIWGSFELEAMQRTEPRGTFLRTDPITLAFAGIGTPSSITPRGATMNHTWSYTLTIQRVDGDGKPLG